jgi:hypothetical protein
MVVIWKTCNGAYHLAELDGAVSKLRYTAFRLIPYFSRSQSYIPVMHVLDREDLISVVEEEELLNSGAPDSNDDAAIIA